MTKKIIFKVFLALLPLIILGVFYLVTDPFMVLRHYPDLYHPNKTHLELNEDYVATEEFLKIYPTEGYDSYVFGSSRSRYYTPEEWLKRKPGIKAFHYGVAMESLYGIAAKLSFIESKGLAIKNAILVVDESLLKTATNSNGHLFRKHPLLSGESKLDFQFAFFIDFFDFEAISSYLKLLTSEEKKLEEDPQILAERQIREDSEAYYQARSEVFYEREPIEKVADPVLKKEHIELLKSIRKIFDKENTDYRIVISPLYDQKKLNPEDLNTLYTIFDTKHVFDFSGINDMTASKYNYFEREHYRPHITNRILDSLYAQEVYR